MNPIVESAELTAAEYLEIEREAETKAEFRRGQRVEMVGATASHVLITGNLHFWLRTFLLNQPAGCVFTSDMRLRVTPDLYTYPDVIFVKSEPEYEGGRQDVLLNPQVVIEVLSPSTESYDRGEKFEYYTHLDSLTHYVLVAQDRPRVEWFTRQDADRWLWQQTQGLDGTAAITELGWQIPLADIYAKVLAG